MCWHGEYLRKFRKGWLPDGQDRGGCAFHLNSSHTLLRGEFSEFRYKGASDPITLRKQLIVSLSLSQTILSLPQFNCSTPC